MNKNINKRKFRTLVNKKINRQIHTLDVYAVMNILFEEIIKDLRNDKEIKIYNFGILKLCKTAPRKYFNIFSNKMMEIPEKYLMRLTFFKKIANKIRKNLDLDKTLLNDD